MDEESEQDVFIGQIIFNKYKLLKKIGEGTFGSIYEAQSIDNNKLYAIKLEDMRHGQYMLENESFILSNLNIPLIPKFKCYGYIGTFIVLVMELLGKSLDIILTEKTLTKLSLRCVCNIAYQIISILEILHNCNIIHLDIKPGNIAIGKGEKSKYIYLLDFGLSIEYNNNNNKNIESQKKLNFEQNNKEFIGNARYSSINALEGGPLSKRDDLESLGYLIVYLALGELPWQGYISYDNRDKYYKIKEIKKKTTPKQLCKDLPLEFEEYINYTKNLKYEEIPNYQYLKNLFINVLKNLKFKFDYYYDWEIKDNEEKKNKEKEYKNYLKDNFPYYNNPNIGNKIKELIEERKKNEGCIFNSDKFIEVDDIIPSNKSKIRKKNSQDTSCCIIY